MNLPVIFETLMKLKEEGRTRAIGVANFNTALFENRRRRHQGADRLRSGRISRDAGPDASAQISRGEIDSPVAYCPLAQGRVASDAALVKIGRSTMRLRRRSH